MIKVNINNTEYDALLDSGASTSLITEKIITEIGKDNKLLPTNKQVLDAQGNCIPIKGQISIDIETKEGRLKKEFLVFKENKKIKIKILIGMNVLKHTSIDFLERKVKFGKEKLPKNQEKGEIIMEIKNPTLFNNDTDRHIKSIEERDNRSTELLEEPNEKMEEKPVSQNQSNSP